MLKKTHFCWNLSLEVSWFSVTYKICKIKIFQDKITTIYILGVLCPELKTLEWWISRLMLDPLFFLISRPIRVTYMKPINLKFCAPFKINIQKREGISNLNNRVLIFLYFIQERVVYEENQKCVYWILRLSYQD